MVYRPAIDFNDDEVAEWLRRWTANPMGSARVGSNPILVVCFFFFFFFLMFFFFFPFFSLFLWGGGGDAFYTIFAIFRRKVPMFAQ